VDSKLLVNIIKI